jgi:hypothetical protein
MYKALPIQVPTYIGIDLKVDGHGYNIKSNNNNLNQNKQSPRQVKPITPNDNGLTSFPALDLNASEGKPKQIQSNKLTLKLRKESTLPVIATQQKQQQQQQEIEIIETIKRKTTKFINVLTSQNQQITGPSSQQQQQQQLNPSVRYSVNTTNINGNSLNINSSPATNVKGNLRFTKSQGFFVSPNFSYIQTINNNNNNNNIKNNNSLALSSSLNISRSKELLHIKPIQISDLSDINENIINNNNNNNNQLVLNNNMTKAEYLIINLKNGGNNNNKNKAIIKNNEKLKFCNQNNNNNSNSNKKHIYHNSAYIDSSDTFNVYSTKF